MTKHSLPIMLATGDHLFHGLFATGGQRVLEMLCHSDSDYLTLRDARVSHRKQISAPVRLSECLVKKDEVLFAIPTIDKQMSPGKKRSAYVRKKQSVAFLTGAGFSIAGYLHLKGCADAVSALTHELGTFLPISDAVIVPNRDGDLPNPAPTVIVNKRFVTSFAIHAGTPDSPCAATTADAEQEPALNC
jgi:hypothetical protein